MCPVGRLEESLVLELRGRTQGHQGRVHRVSGPSAFTCTSADTLAHAFALHSPHHLLCSCKRVSLWAYANAFGGSGVFWRVGEQGWQRHVGAVSGLGLQRSRACRMAPAGVLLNSLCCFFSLHSSHCLSFCLSLHSHADSLSSFSLSSFSHTHTHSLSLVLVVMIKSKELKTKISLTHSLILSSFCSVSFITVSILVSLALVSTRLSILFDWSWSPIKVQGAQFSHSSFCLHILSFPVSSTQP